MPAAARSAVFFPLLVLVAPGVAACGSSSKTTTSAAASATGATTATNVATTPTTAGTRVLVGEHQSVALNPATSQLLRGHQIVVTAVAPAR